MQIIVGRKPVSVPVLPIVTVLVLVVLVLSAASVGSIQGNQIGVLVNNLTGGIQVRAEAGSLIYNGLITDFWVVDNTTQTVKMVGDDRVNIKTADGADVRMDVEANYRLVQDVEVFRSKVIPECGLDMRLEVSNARGATYRESVDAYKGKWVRDYCRSVIRTVFGELHTGEFYRAELREKSAREAEKELNRLLLPHGIEVLKVIPNEFHFYTEYEKIIADKKAADQEVQSQIELAKKAFEEQKKKETEARAVAVVAIARQNGELQKELLQAEAQANASVRAAEAYAISTKLAAEAEFYKASNEAHARLANSQAEAEGLRLLAASLAGEGGSNLVRLEYAKALAGAQIEGVPYATDPRIQKVELDTKTAESRKPQGGSQ